MAAINLLFDKSINVEIAEKIIIFKLNGNIIEEYLIPDDCDIKKFIDNTIVIGLKRSLSAEIPVGYSRLGYNVNGLEQIYSDECLTTKIGYKHRKELFL